MLTKWPCIFLVGRSRLMDSERSQHRLEHHLDVIVGHISKIQLAKFAHFSKFFGNLLIIGDGDFLDIFELTNDFETFLSQQNTGI